MILITRIKLVVVLIISTLVMGCGPNEAILKSGSNNTETANTETNASTKYDSVESEVENMRTANFDFILVLKRKDGGKMQQDDKAFVRITTPNSNRRTLASGDTAIVIGSNSRVPPEIFKVLSDRFIVDDFSKPEAEVNSNVPANANIVR